MEGYQFAHMETYSIQGAPGNKKSGTKVRKSGERAWTVEEVLQEVERSPLASLHVQPGGPPPQILPGTVGTFADVRAEHAKAAAVKESYLRKGKGGKKKKEKRKLRADARTLYSSVVSLPTLSEDALSNPLIKAQCISLILAAMAHERQSLSKAGGALLMGVIHWDEDHVHAHFLAIAPQTGRVDGLHPGRAAKSAFNVDNAEEKARDPKAVGKGANQAYCAAMRQWQDDFFDSVFSDAGLLRYGPKRHRLSRADYNKAKTLKAQQAKDVDRSAALATQIAEQQGQISAMMQEADATAKQLTRQSVDLQGEKIDLLVRESETASLAARGREEIARAKAKTSSAEAMTAAITVGIKAIDDREIDYLPATREKRAGLSFGPTAPTEKTKRERLMATIMPAFDMLVGVASRVFGIRKREAALAEAEAAQVKQEQAQKDEASELRRRANVIATAIERTGKAAPGPLQNVAEGQSAAMEEASFPGAWAIAPGARPDDLSKRLNATTNLDLRAAYQATRDAVLITDEHAPLRARFDLGLRVLAANADDRGFDLETGRQDLAKAKRPEVAALHVDQFSEPIKVRVQERERQRLRGS